MDVREEKLDVLVVGAGVSGLGMAYKLQKERPNDSFAVLEAREAIGGTWDLFRYPGIRSDSDMYTFSYSFKPWREREHIGSGEAIRNYLNELVEEEGLGRYIRFQNKVISANWDTAQERWLVTVQCADNSTYLIKAKFVIGCVGYYNYEQGYLPKFEGYDDFKGTIAHPQHWPQDLDYAGKKVIVIGSGATAITIAPSMAKTAQVTMLQRSPSYVASIPAADPWFRFLSKFLPAGLTNRIMRMKYVARQTFFYSLAKKYPDVVRNLIMGGAKKALQRAADVDVHFNPSYKPWDQRLCMVPDNDLFIAIKEKRVAMETDHIERFTEKGILLKSGKQLEADIIVPATGLDLQFMEKMNATVDGAKIDSAALASYKGMMFSQIPNFAWIFGYTNASWTLKAELTYGYLCRLLTFMEKKEHSTVYPYLDPTKPFKAKKMIDLQSGYFLRASDILPSQGEEYPWCNKEIYLKDRFAIKHSKIDDDVLVFDDCSLLKTTQVEEPSSIETRGAA